MNERPRCIFSSDLPGCWAAAVVLALLARQGWECLRANIERRRDR